MFIKSSLHVARRTNYEPLLVPARENILQRILNSEVKKKEKRTFEFETRINDELDGEILFGGSQMSPQVLNLC